MLYCSSRSFLRYFPFITDKCVLTRNSIHVRRNSQDTKVLKIATIGTANAGKSTLINHIVERRVFAVSKKVHTTRVKARAIYVEGNTQLVFLDTPGLVSLAESNKFKFEPEFRNGGEEAILEADLIAVVHDVSNVRCRDQVDRKVLRLLHLHANKESILVLNKVDAIKSKRTLLDLATSLTAGKLRSADNPAALPGLSELNMKEYMLDHPHWEWYRDVFMVSALTGHGVEDLRNYLVAAAHPAPWPFPADHFTDKAEVQLIEDTVKSKLLEYLPNEIPYSIRVELEYLDSVEPGQRRAVVLLHCPKPKVRKVVIGSGGTRIQKIAKEAELALQQTFLSDFYLKLAFSEDLSSRRF